MTWWMWAIAIMLALTLVSAALDVTLIVTQRVLIGEYEKQLGHEKGTNESLKENYLRQVAEVTELRVQNRRLVSRLATLKFKGFESPAVGADELAEEPQRPVEIPPELAGEIEMIQDPDVRLQIQSEVRTALEMGENADDLLRSLLAGASL